MIQKESWALKFVFPTQLDVAPRGVGAVQGSKGGARQHDRIHRGDLQSSDLLCSVCKTSESDKQALLEKSVGKKVKVTKNGEGGAHHRGEPFCSRLTLFLKRSQSAKNGNKQTNSVWKSESYK